LGTLVAIGVALSALVMVMIYLPPLFPARRKAPQSLAPVPWWTYFMPAKPTNLVLQATGARETVGQHEESSGRPHQHGARGRHVFVPLLPLVTTGALVVIAIAILFVNRPKLDRSSGALRPQYGAAEMALDEIKSEMKL